MKIFSKEDLNEISNEIIEKIEEFDKNINILVFSEIIGIILDSKFDTKTHKKFIDHISRLRG